MNILIIGSGAREYSMGLALKKDPRVEKILFYPGNGATPRIGENLSFASYEELAAFALALPVDLTVVGPEQPLVEGVSDLFRSKGLAVFGPSALAARLEGSKGFMKQFAARNSLPTARFLETESEEEARAFIQSLTPPVVVKADGLCAGKGVIIAQSHQEAIEAVLEMLSGEGFGEAGKKVVIEEFLDGFELSVFAVSDGEDYVILPACQDHKRLLSGNQGPNTGGMGAYAPTPLATPELLRAIDERIIAPTISAMKAEGYPFEGTLFAGIMVVRGEPYLLEFNVRFGDPECEVLMPLFKTPLLDLLLASAKGEIKGIKVEFHDRFCMGVVMASGNYPYGNSTPEPILLSPLYQESEESHISFAGVSLKGEELLASGGRVLVCVGLGSDVREARERAYALSSLVDFKGRQYRDDIAHEVL
ncbi:phosphoribosylamine--glycine ligase [Wolinella succinogenes]|uniref:Phosphoribosylamine--glycine ligase n=1 Tax=Wolinella succinogenes (strain ATCC 29543 / DSM 1740 / CCUG 13145 / JCM 31913 / LMG 7466 / NCTC 11488 / FDC 602W) TaxID=273121 RepID=Q7M9I6_WOLSU|nr:phosphoribosylamine--glycine ligase [Wolinella succinogenes]NLU35219.1 phosphoribosylamine--glycine ligase [Wolinella succinogenes]CAE09999.1 PHOSPHORIBOSYLAMINE-GLYCINE LIGASE [Wolinella succinogenes]VEG82211.1 Phosphoribosylamine--glycine ligase [Wolinella succinogenes]HCZ19488.1 phosphoribosylamine--glycine ligase [Helicobacter sp.]